MNTPAEILKALLIQPSAALFTDPEDATAWPLYISAMPDGTGVEENCGAVYDTEGRVVTRLLASGTVIVLPGCQIKVRALDYAVGYSRLKDVSEELSAVKYRTPITIGLNSYRIDSIIQTSPVISMGQDPLRRAMFSLNVLLALVG